MLDIYGEPRTGGKPWTSCTDNFSIENDKFQVSMETSDEQFAKDITNHPESLLRLLKVFPRVYNKTQEELAKVKFAMGSIIGSYGTECDQYRDVWNWGMLLLLLLVKGTFNILA